MSFSSFIQSAPTSFILCPFNSTGNATNELYFFSTVSTPHLDVKCLSSLLMCITIFVPRVGASSLSVASSIVNSPSPVELHFHAFPSPRAPAFEITSTLSLTMKLA